MGKFILFLFLTVGGAAVGAFIGSALGGGGAGLGGVIGGLAGAFIAGQNSWFN